MMGHEKIGKFCKKIPTSNTGLGNAFENFFRSTFFSSPKVLDQKVKPSLLVTSGKQPGFTRDPYK